MSEANTQPVVMKSLSEAFGMNPLVVGAPQPAEQEIALPVLLDETEMSKEDKEAEEDFYLARENTKRLLDKADQALEGILRIADASEAARAYEVASTLINNIKELNSGLLKLHEQRRQLVPVSEPEKPATTNITNNNVFVGTTQELLDLLEERDRQNEDNVIEHDPGSRTD